MAKTGVFFSLVTAVGAAGVLVGVDFAVDLCVFGRSLEGPLRGGGGVVGGLGSGGRTGGLIGFLFFLGEVRVRVRVRVRVGSELLRINLYCKVRGNFVF